MLNYSKLAFGLPLPLAIAGESWYILSGMRYAIIADIHANLPALTAVLGDIDGKGGVEELWSLGDIVGYGPDPHQCIQLLRQRQHISVAGNHDWGAIGKAEPTEFNPDAAAALRWTAEQLAPEDIDYLGGLPQMIERGDFTLVHGSPREPIWEYLVTISNAGENYAHFQSPFCLAGHAHKPMVFKQDGEGAITFHPLSPGVGLLLSGGRLIINPGSVGQPRDGDPRASYAIYDTDAGMLRLYRVPYDINIVQNRMIRNNLPVRLVARLSQGL